MVPSFYKFPIVNVSISDVRIRIQIQGILGWFRIQIRIQTLHSQTYN